jgi:hypothetical protein
MKRIHTFEASDGMTFTTAEDCKAHEETQALSLLRDLTEQDIMSALARSNIPLANAIERAGNIIGTKRRESGELKRAKKMHPEQARIAEDLNANLKGAAGPRAKESVAAAMDNIKKNMKAIS